MGGRRKEDGVRPRAPVVNLAVLCIATVLNRVAAPLIVLVGGLVGLVLAPEPALATLPVPRGRPT